MAVKSNPRIVYNCKHVWKKMEKEEEIETKGCKKWRNVEQCDVEDFGEPVMKRCGKCLAEIKSGS